MRVNTQSGMTMIEVVVTVAITTVGLLGLSALQLQSVKSVSDSGNRTHAIWVANDLINRIKANEVAMNNYITSSRISCDGIPENVPMCSSYNTGSEARSAEVCSNNQLATFDLWETLCGVSKLTGGSGMSNSASFISNAKLSISNLGNNDLEIEISWNSRTGGETSKGDKEYYVELGKTAEVQRERYTVVFEP